jgi:DNA-binding MarR family transcriptional regulator
MERQAERELEILIAIDEGKPLTQRALAQRLGVAVGLTNLYLRRLMRKGYIKVGGFPRKPAVRKLLRYLLTGKGIAEKSRLTYEYMTHSLRLYRRARAHLREAMVGLPNGDARKVALYGADDAAELAYLTLCELGLEPIAVFDGHPGRRFLGFEVRDVRELGPTEFDAIVVATFDKPDAHVAALTALGVPRDRLVTLRQ